MSRRHGHGYAVVLLDEDGNVVRELQTGLTFGQALQKRDEIRERNTRYEARHLVQIQHGTSMLVDGPAHD